MSSKKQNTEYVKLDIKKIFLTPPDTRREKITLLFIMVVVFMIFFGPLTFTNITPLKAVILSAFPTLTISWAWIVLLRFIGRKKDFCVKEK